MIKIICPDNNNEERLYSIAILFKEVLGVPYEVSFSQSEQNYIISSDDFRDNRMILIEDHLWGNHKKVLSYFSLDNIPDHFTKLEIGDFQTYVVYGRGTIVEDCTSIIVGGDLFASTFFLVTRWEEFLMGRIETGDCDEQQLLSVKCNLSHRPLVNEYAVALQILFNKCGYNIPDSKRIFKIILTHDVDELYLNSWRNIYQDSLSDFPRFK